MNIFVGFGYNDKDLWINELVFPLIKSFDATIVTGEDLHGQVLSHAVIDRIKKSDAMLAFLTRRDELPDGRFTSHRWVYDELSMAIANNIPAVEIRDIKVDSQGGLPGDRQRVDFELDNKAKLMVDLTGILVGWMRKIVPKRMVILPKEIVQEARPHISTNNLTCSYQFMDGSRQSPEYTTKPFRYGQGLCVDVCNVPSEEALIQITLKGPQFSWTSDYESVKLLPINLQKD